MSRPSEAPASIPNHRHRPTISTTKSGVPKTKTVTENNQAEVCFTISFSPDHGSTIGSWSFPDGLRSRSYVTSRSPGLLICYRLNFKTSDHQPDQRYPRSKYGYTECCNFLLQRFDCHFSRFLFGFLFAFTAAFPELLVSHNNFYFKSAIMPGPGFRYQFVPGQ